MLGQGQKRIAQALRADGVPSRQANARAKRLTRQAVSHPGELATFEGTDHVIHVLSYRISEGATSY